ncbi:LacI family DNA-binding transcriptional regulator [Vannielia litorea]|uniref:LacI family DNA-binding transcriptional regulator n=1 Tax=Vannielia litorea TaxID=1217970 RepID=UPI001C970C54|nr:LacI family DNA-binding transcriptional regulator [Vannielia litorea]MBY6048817.1 LacI family DNA-binding transcriptional regulator [Vannielia litorea]MBY6076231.1 LacI family DNA-binding transcriptional regulator [Vannielia litorea]
MAQKTVRIRDVAREAGVSTATVSRALSNPDLLTESTRKAVEDAVRITGYRVNHAARNLRMQRAGAVLVLVPNLGNPFFSTILAAISESFAGTDTSVLIADTASGGRELTGYFLDGRIDGMISLDGGLAQSDLAAFDSAGVAERIVFACEWVDGSTLPSVRSDNEEGARLAVQHLHDLGHRDIAHVTGPAGNVLTKARRAGMLAERARLGLPSRDDWIIRGDFSLASGRDAAHRIIAMKDRPSAVFCASDQVAFALMSTLMEAGLRVPEDISVIGFDDIELSKVYTPSLTTIRQDRHALGRRAAQLLLEQIAAAGDPLAPVAPDRVEMVGVELVTRQSTAVPG